MKVLLAEKKPDRLTQQYASEGCISGVNLPVDSSFKTAILQGVLMERLILHIGPPKCASSTVQGFLSRFPVLARADTGADTGAGMVRYMAVQPTGEVFSGEVLKSAAEKSPYGYLNSAPDLLEDRTKFEVALRKLGNLCGPNDIVVLSAERWGTAGIFADCVKETLAACPVPIDVFMLARPLVDWINAATWEVAFWECADPQAWFDRVKEMNFLKVFREWQKINAVERVVVRDVSQGPIDCLLEFLGSVSPDRNWDKSLNRRSDFHLLRHLVRNKAHFGRVVGNAEVEFTLNRFIKGTRARTPNLVPRAVAQEVIARDRRDNEVLIKLMQESGKLLNEEVIARYLDVSVFGDLSEEVNLFAGLDANYPDEFVRTLVDTILDLGNQVSERHTLLTALHEFDPRHYLDIHSDVREVGMNPYEHYLRFGFREGRRLR